MKKCFLIVLSALLLIFLFGCSSNKKNVEIIKFNISDFSDKYKEDEYSNYISAVCCYYNELINLCEDLIEKDYTILLTSNKLENYNTLIQTESNSLKKKTTDKSALNNISDIDICVASTVYLVSSYNTTNYFLTQSDDNLKVKASSDISIYDDIILSIEETRKILKE